MDFTRILPEECQILIISLTSPLDACRSAMVSTPLRSVANSDQVWEKFLPSGYKSIISGSSSLLSLGKKDLYVHLSLNPVLIRNGTMSFQLDKETGKKCYMLGAKTLSIIWGDTPAYWIWTSLLDSRFPEVAMLNLVWWLEMKGKIETKILSSNTNYAAYLVFRIGDTPTGFRRRSVDLQVDVDGITSGEVRRVSLDPLQDEPRQVRERDGWLEVEMGEFLNECGDDGTVEFCLRAIDTSYIKRGLIVEGIELRPKDMGSNRLPRRH